MMKSSSYQNPYHSVAAQADNEAGLATLRQGVEYEINDFVALELTAERMVADEAALLGAYLADDAGRMQGFWHDLKDELVMWELSAGRFLLSAADPTRTEWQRSGWWKSEADAEFGSGPDNNADLH